MPGTDDWYIAYHRFAIPGGDGMHRETTIDRLSFDADGPIKKVVPTLGGIDPLTYQGAGRRGDRVERRHGRLVRRRTPTLTLTGGEGVKRCSTGSATARGPTTEAGDAAGRLVRRRLPGTG